MSNCCSFIQPCKQQTFRWWRRAKKGGGTPADKSIYRLVVILTVHVCCWSEHEWFSRHSSDPPDTSAFMPRAPLVHTFNFNYFVWKMKPIGLIYQLKSWVKGSKVTGLNEVLYSINHLLSMLYKPSLYLFWARSQVCIQLIDATICCWLLKLNNNIVLMVQMNIALWTFE